MCTLVISRFPQSDWPVIIGANRDEMNDRPWAAPARHWPDRDDVVAGLDVTAGGSWMGLNDQGVVAAILNRMGTLGPQAGKRSRGELVLEALDHADAVDAAQSLAHLDARAWRPFNMVVADNRDAFWLRADGGARLSVHPIGSGVHILTAADLDDGAASPRIARYAPLFAQASRPRPDAGEWQEWEQLLASGGSTGSGETEDAALCFTRSNGFGTVSSSLLALPAIGSAEKPMWRFAAGRPDQVPFKALF